MSGKRPEHIAPPDIFYNEAEAKKYAYNSRMITIQTKMSERAIELLNLPNHPCHILDIGCGSGLSGEVLSEQGHTWVGLDISRAMLGVAIEREVMGDLVYSDAGDGLMFRPGSFDACISISAIQWLCNADKRSHVPQKRLKVFFNSLYKCLTKGARAVLQFYPENPAQVSMITTAAMRAGFRGGLVVDFPNSTKAKKYFLCLFAGETSDKLVMPEPLAAKAMDEEELKSASGAIDQKTGQSQDTILFGGRSKEKRKRIKGKKGKRLPVKSRQWILRKKESARKAGKKTYEDSKYTARRRRPRF
ncbi:hypothetical protein AAMO2058_001616300 [Amorphochlora amoebiformis]|mmetsp:Transcript_10238/g.16143  ORF Transcript_10238/g.16143 Transcript_10238/m.16143 type:complete len:303 (-) Transcript_10238:129-1037(-)